MTGNKNSTEINDVISRIAVKLVKNPGISPLVTTIAGDMLNEWSADSKIKRMVAFPVKKILPGEVHDAVQPKTSLASDIGRLITLLAISVNEERAKHSEGKNGNRGKGSMDFFANSDFGEILEMVVKSEDGVKPAIEAFNKALWTYPTKFTSIVAMLGPLYRMGVKLVNEFLAPILNDVGPDLLADIVMAILKDSDSGGLAKLIDGVNELIRRIHTGSLLIGKGDKSKLDVTLDDLMKAYYDTKIPYLQKMMPVYFGEIRESIANASERSLRDNEKIFLAQIGSMGAATSLDIKVKNARLRLYESVDQEKLGEVMSENLKEFDTYEAAGLVNGFCRVLNQIHDVQPGILGSLVTGVVDSVSTDEVSRTAEWLIPDLVNAVKPVASAIMPELLKALSDLIRDDGYADGKYHEAVKDLRETLSVAGGVK
jgi:hypothetical protein